jgi:hypothetical protein
VGNVPVGVDVTGAQCLVVAGCFDTAAVVARLGHLGDVAGVRAAFAHETIPEKH